MTDITVVQTPVIVEVSPQVFNVTVSSVGAQGAKGDTGSAGRGIVSITKKTTTGLVDTYEITYTDASTSTFTVTNGRGISTLTKTGTVGLTDTYTITFNDGSTLTYGVTNGRGISDLSKISTVGLVDNYRITYNDGTTFDYSVTNGAQGIQGPKGDMGTFVPKGNWASGTTYSQYDLVTNRGKTWYALQTNTNQEPITDGGSFWKLMAFGWNNRNAWVINTIYYAGDTVTYNGSVYYYFETVTLANRTFAPPFSPHAILLASKGDQGPKGDYGFYYTVLNDIIYASAPAVNANWSPLNSTVQNFGVDLEVESAYYFEGQFKINGSTQATPHSLAFRPTMVAGGAYFCVGTIQTYRQSGSLKVAPSAAGSLVARQIETYNTAVGIEIATSTVVNRLVTVKGYLNTDSTAATPKFAPHFQWFSASETPTILAGSYFLISKLPTATGSNGTWT